MREITVAEAIEITEIRRAVEAIVAGRAAENITDDQIVLLRGIEADMRAAVEQNELVRYSELNASLHGTLRDIAGHTAATRILEQLNGQMVRHQFRLFLVPGRPTVSLPEHLAIVEAVCSRDPEAASAAMAAHVGSVIGTLTELASEQRSGGHATAL